MRRKKVLAFLLALLCFSFGGCLPRSTEDLFALPQQSVEYYALQSQIDGVLHTGGEYSAPVSGDHRQAVQLVDLDSDGQEEAIVFIRTQGEKPLKIYIYRQTEDGYEQAAVIEGDGSAFESVSYCQIDTALGLEMVVGRQVSDQVPQTLSVYALRDMQVTELLNVSCIRHTVANLDNDGLQELLVFRTDEDAAVGLAEYYRWNENALELSGSADMTAPLTADSIRRLIYGLMQENIPAVFLANTYEESSIVTDVFILDGDTFKNVSLQGVNDAAQVRYRNVYAEDIDDDGLIELPRLVTLALYPGLTTKPLSKLQWYNLLPDGSRDEKQTTFHNYSDGWYVDLLPAWENGLCVGYVLDDTQQPCYSFYQNGNGALFAIYAFSDSNARELSEEDGRFILAEKGDVLYCGKLLSSTVTPEQLQNVFHFIYTDWNSGEV